MDGTDEYYQRFEMVLISPAPEYFTFLKKYRHLNSDGMYETTLTPPVTLNISPEWLSDTLRSYWPDISFNVRQPHLQAYSLDWLLTVEGNNLLGGLHRDGYAVVLTGDTHAVNTFAVWYRGIVAPKHKLFIYEWADVARELRPGITIPQLERLRQRIVK